MNKTYRSVWNQALGTWVAVSELAHANGKRSSSTIAIAAVAVLLGAPFGSALAQNVSLSGSNGELGGDSCNSVYVPSECATENTAVLGAVNAATWTHTAAPRPGVLIGANVTNTNTGPAVSGAASVTAGGVARTGRTWVGFEGGTTGSLNVSGAGSRWQAGGIAVIGHYGTGSLTVADGGLFQSTNSYVGMASTGVGNVLITGVAANGTRSSWVSTNNTLYLGGGFVGPVSRIGGNGTVTVEDGGLITTTAGGLRVGQAVGGVGVLNVRGVHSSGVASGVTTTGATYVGNFGTGTMNIESGGTVSNTTGIVGGGAITTDLSAANVTTVVTPTMGVGTVNVSGINGTQRSTWTNSLDLAVGNYGTGTMNVTDGALVTSEGGTIGRNAGSTGTVTVSGVNANGTASTWNNNTSDLIIGNAGTGTLNVLNGGQVSNTKGFVGAIAGGTVLVSGVNANGTASTWSNSDVLTVGYASAPNGTLTVADGGVVSAPSVVIGSLADATGTVNVGGTATGAAAAPGTLSTPTIAFGDGTGSLNFNHTSSGYDFDAALSSGTGTGALNQIAGVTRLSADSGAFTGATNVKGGTLIVNGSIANSVVTVGNGGTLGGTGTVGATTVQSGGIVAPGNSIGTLNVNGTYAQASGSTYRVEVDSSTLSTADRIDVTGSATLEGGSVLQVVKTSPSAYTLGSKYTVLSATGGVTGTYQLTGQTDASAFVRIIDAYDANNVYLVTEQNRSLVDAAITPNETATAVAAQALPSINPLFDALVFLPNDAAARAAFNQLSGEIHASVQTGMLDDSRFAREAVNDRLLGAFCAPGASDQIRKQHPTAARSEDDCAPGTGTTAWGRVFGSTGHVHSDGNAARFDRDIGGFFAGADTALAGGWRVGGLAGFSRSNFDVDARGSSAKGDSYTLGAYGGTQWGPTSLRLGASYSWYKLDTQRGVNFAGYKDSLSAKYDASTTQLFGEIGHRFNVSDVVAIEPFAGLAYVKVKTDGFAERGGYAALTGRGSDTDTTFSTLGARFSAQVSDSTKLRATLGWRHAFGRRVPTSTHSFAGGQDFLASGVLLAKNVGIAEAGVETQLKSNLKLSVSYTGQYGSGLNDNGVKATLDWKF